MTPEFIFMLTRADATIAGALSRLPEALSAGVRSIGFKDVGAPFAELRALAAAIRASGARLYLELVSLDAAAEARGAQAAVNLGVDVLMGGVRPDVVLPIIEGTAVRYYPFPGAVVGHPSRLEGAPEAIAATAQTLLAHEGVHGLDLLAYRFDGDVPALMRRVCAAAGERPVIMAGSIDSPERIAEVVGSGAAGFTVGTGALDGVFPTGPSLTDQLTYIASVAAGCARAA